MAEICIVGNDLANSIKLDSGINRSVAALPIIRTPRENWALMRVSSYGERNVIAKPRMVELSYYPRIA